MERVGGEGRGGREGGREGGRVGGEGGWEGREGGREGGRGGREGGREGGRPVWRNHHLLSLPSLSHPKAWQLYCQERACLPKAVTLPSQKPEGFTLRKKKKARVLRRVEWLPFYEKKKKKKKNQVQKSKVFTLRKIKRPEFYAVSNGFNFTRGKKKKKKKKKVQKSKVFTLRKKRARVLRRVEWLQFYEGKKKKKKKKKPSPKVQGFYAA